MQKMVLLHTEEGKLVNSEILDVEDVVKAVREAVIKAIEKWNPIESDFTVIRSQFEVRYSLPLNPDVYDKIVEMGLEVYREGNEVIVKVPVFTISYDNKWLGDSYYDRGIIVLSPYLDDEEVRQLADYAVDVTREPKRITETTSYTLELSEEEMKRLEEGLEEAVAVEEKPSKKSKGRKRKRTRPS